MIDTASDKPPHHEAWFARRARARPGDADTGTEILLQGGYNIAPDSIDPHQLDATATGYAYV